jgi:hypothetical protein
MKVKWVNRLDIILFIFDWYNSLNRGRIYINFGLMFSTAGPNGEYPKYYEYWFTLLSDYFEAIAVLVEFFCYDSNSHSQKCLNVFKILTSIFYNYLNTF